jgi:tight adherence protein C
LEPWCCISSAASSLEDLAMLSTGELFVYGGMAMIAIAGGAIAVIRRMKFVHISRQLKRVTGGYDDTVDDDIRHRFAAVVGKKVLLGQGDLGALSKALRSAGFYAPRSPYIFAATQVTTSAVTAVLALILAVDAWQSTQMIVNAVIVGLSLGYLLPRFVLRCLGNARRRRIHQELPLFIDILLLLLRSGLGLERCFREIERVGVDAVPTIHPTIRLLLVDLDQGRGYDEALLRWDERMSVPSATEIARYLQQSLSHGTEVAKTLSTFAQRYVEQRLIAGREKAGRRSSLVTLVTVGLFLPPLLIILCGPAFSQLGRLFVGG